MESNIRVSEAKKIGLELQREIQTSISDIHHVDIHLELLEDDITKQLQ